MPVYDNKTTTDEPSQLRVLTKAHCPTCQDHNGRGAQALEGYKRPRAISALRDQQPPDPP